MTESRLIRVCAPYDVRFTQEAIDGIVGDEFPLTLEDEPYGTGRCIGAELADGGKSILLTVEADSFPDGAMTLSFVPDEEVLPRRGPRGE